MSVKHDLYLHLLGAAALNLCGSTSLPSLRDSVPFHQELNDWDLPQPEA